MWESTVVESTRRRTSGRSVTSAVASSLLHGAALASVAVLSLMTIEFPQGSPAQIRHYMLSAQPVLPPPPPPAPLRRQQAAPVTAMKELFAPATVPEEIPIVEEAAAQPQVDETSHGVEGGVEGGTDAGTIGGTVGGVVSSSAPSLAPAFRLPGEPIFVPRGETLPMAKLSAVYPEYPERARLERLEGSVVVRYRIDKKGRVRDLELIEPGHRLFNESTVRALSTWRYRPMMVEGEPVEVVHEVMVIFRLDRG